MTIYLSPPRYPYKDDPFSGVETLHIWKSGMNTWKWKCPCCKKTWTNRNIHISRYKASKPAYDRCKESAMKHLKEYHVDS